MPSNDVLTVYYKKHWTYYPFAWALIALTRIGIRPGLDSRICRAFMGTVRVKFGESGRWEKLSAQ